MIIRRLPRRGPAGHHPHGVDVDLAAALAGERLYIRHVVHRLLEGDAA